MVGGEVYACGPFGGEGWDYMVGGIHTYVVYK